MVQRRFHRLGRSVNQQAGSNRKSLSGPDATGVYRFAKQAELFDIQELKKKKIEEPLLVKIALVLVNMKHTKAPVALFGRYQAGRTWPFFRTCKTRGCQVRWTWMDVDGPTV